MITPSSLNDVTRSTTQVPNAIEGGGFFDLLSSENKLVINLLRTKEMVFRRPNPRLFIPPPLSDDIERVYVFKLLGITLCPNLRFGEHISKVLAACM
jgi:hypothetical protein